MFQLIVTVGATLFIAGLIALAMIDWREFFEKIREDKENDTKKIPKKRGNS